MQNFQNQLSTPALPDLPNPQDRYDRMAASQTNGLLRSFFIRITSVLSDLFGVAGARFIDAPNGLFFSTADQTAEAADTAYKVTFNQTYLSNGVSLTDSSRITIATGGVYLFNFSAQVKLANAAAKTVSIWISRNGTDIGYSTRQTTITGINHLNSINWCFSIDVTAGSYVEIVWAADSTELTLEAMAPSAPYVGSPSAVMSVSYVAPLPVTLPTPP